MAVQLPRVAPRHQAAQHLRLRLRKRPSTSELVDWIAVLRRAGIDGVKLEENLPFLGALLKKEQDLVSFADQLSGGRQWRS